MPDSNGLAPFGATSTTDEVLAGIDLRGKRVLVTGVSAGLGVETARALAARGAHVIGAARDLRKAESAMEQAWAAARNGGGVELIELDLAALASVRSAADRLVAAGKPLDLVINNAGVMACPLLRTEDGFEMQFGTNHLGHFVFTNRIAPLLRAGSRVVALASMGHRSADIDLDDPNFERTPYDPWQAYGRSKTANILFAVAFDKRHRERGVRATAVHPGGIKTELGRHLSDADFDTLLARLNADLAAKGKPPFWLKTVPQGAATSVWAGVVAPAEAVGGRYCENCQVTTRVTDGDIDMVDGGVRPYAVDPARAEVLWAKSEALVGESFM
ncbi:SDR family NAD(P)-dependent oxidoreductase [Dongia sp.]|uniref:SDR family NAD(P)-dependent oxidoreductase n=1 Tax=Dongia sp. TaxID=1977262 RepID=UPI0037525B9A